MLGDLDQGGGSAEPDVLDPSLRICEGRSDGNEGIGILCRAPAHVHHFEHRREGDGSETQLAVRGFGCTAWRDVLNGG